MERLFLDNIDLKILATLAIDCSSSSRRYEYKNKREKKKLRERSFVVVC
jgi:hypothetical protein